MFKKSIQSAIIVFFAILISSIAYGQKLKWDPALTPVNGYKIYYGTSPGDYSFMVDVGDVTEYLLSDLPVEEGVTYYFIVKSYDSVSESADSNIIEYTFVFSEGEDLTPPMVPQNLIVDIQGTDSFVRWTENSEFDLQGYRFYLGKNSRDYDLPIQIGKVSSYQLTNLTIGDTYYASLTAIDNNNNESGFSSEVIVSIPEEIPEEIPEGTTEGLTRVIIVNDDYSADTSADYSNISGTLIITDEQAHGQAWRTTRYYHNTDLGESDHWVQADVTYDSNSGVSGGLIGRVDNTKNTGYEIYFASGRLYLQKFTGSNSSWVSQYIGGFTSGTYRLRMEIVGTTIKIYVNEELRIEKEDSTYTSGTHAGIRIQRNSLDTDSSVDNLQAGVFIKPDTIKPEINIISPSNNSIVQTDIIHITGNSSDAIGVTKVSWKDSNGNSGIAAGTDNWAIEGINLIEGENVITVTAEDEAGNQGSGNVIVVYQKPDTVAPVVSITLPTTEKMINTIQSTISLSGTASDNIGVMQVEWLSSAGAGGSAAGTVNWIVDMISLVEGENAITITARDEAGNESTDTLTVVYTIPDTIAPEIAITTPTSGSSYETKSDSLSIGGTASDAIGVIQVAWSNSRGGSGTATGTTSWNVPDISLGEGQNVITITARDEAGNTGTGILTAVYTKPDIITPEITKTALINDDYSTDTSADYSNISGTLIITNDEAHGQAWRTTRYYHNTSLGGSDHWVQADVTYDSSSGVSGGLIGRVDTTKNTGYETFFASGRLYLQKFAGSKSSWVSQYIGGFTSGTYRLRMEIVGSAIKIYVNEELRIEKEDTTYTSGTRAGIRIKRNSLNTDSSVDNFQAGSFKTSGLDIVDFFSEDSSGNYINISGGISIAGGAAHGQIWKSTRSYHKTQLSSSDHWVEADVEYTISDHSSGLIARVDSVNRTGYETYFAANRLYLQKFAGNSSTWVGFYLGNYAPGTYKIKMEIVGNKIKVYVNNELKIEKIDSTYSTGDYAGIIIKRGNSESDPVIDDFKAGAF
ncbi:MAG: Ig-like domain-containing protein [Pseudomonadota bacterium]